MTKRYVPKNRFCRNTKLSEDEFTEAVDAYMRGLGAAALARRNGRSERAMRTLYARLRQRIMHDEYLSGWMGGGPDKLPASDDPIWPMIYDCMSACPAQTTSYLSTSPAYMTQFRGLDPDGAHKQRVLSFERKAPGIACQSCAIGLRFRLDRSVWEEWGKHDLRCGGIPRENFKQHFFEIMFRTNIRVKSRKFPDAVRNMNTEIVLGRLREKPL